MITTSKYESLCCNCHKAQTCGDPCEKWVTQYMSIQEAINFNARKIVSRFYRASDTKFGYMTPDEYLRYLASDPCEGCQYSPFCEATDQVCLKYMTHFREKLEFLRKRAESHEARK